MLNVRYGKQKGVFCPYLCTSFKSLRIWTKQMKGSSTTRDPAEDLQEESLPWSQFKFCIYLTLNHRSMVVERKKANASCVLWEPTIQQVSLGIYRQTEITIHRSITIPRLKIHTSISKITFACSPHVTCCAISSKFTGGGRDLRLSLAAPDTSVRNEPPSLTHSGTDSLQAPRGTTGHMCIIWLVPPFAAEKKYDSDSPNEQEGEKEMRKEKKEI